MMILLSKNKKKDVIASFFYTLDLWMILASEIKILKRENLLINKYRYIFNNKFATIILINTFNNSKVFSKFILNSFELYLNTIFVKLK